MELINIFSTLRRWSWLIISIMVVTVVALFWGLKLAKPVYEAQATLQLSTPPQEDVALYDQYRYVDVRDMVTVARNNFIAILKSDEVHNRTVKKLNIDTERIEFGLEITSNSDSDFVVVLVSAPSSPLAASIANTIVDQAVDYYGELRAKPTIKERDLYAEQLQTAEEAYRAAADAFTLFKAENDIGVLPEEIATAQRLLEQLQSERDKRVLEFNVKDPVSQVNNLINQHQQELDRLLALQPMYLILEENYQEAREGYRLALSPNGLNINRTVAEEKYRQAEQAFNEFKTQNNITSMQDEIAVNNKLLEQLQLDLDQRFLKDADEEGSKNQVDELILQRNKELDRLSALQPMYTVLEQKANEAQTKYQHILSKYTEAELKATVVRAANFIQIIEPASEPPLALSNSNLLVFGILGSLGLGIILAFLLDYLSMTNKEALLPDKFESQSFMGIPILGSMPVLENPLYNTDSQEAEKIRQLRENIILLPKSHSLKTILITSPQKGDGKTLTVANLGAAMAERGVNVVLVDADMRNSYLHEVLGQPNLGGMSDLLSAYENSLPQLLSQCLQKTVFPGLSFLSAGTLTQDPSSRLSSGNMEFIFKELSRKFDFVLVDSPPFHVAPDSTILSKFVDGILLVVQPGNTSLRATEEMVQSFKSNGANIFGIALNHTLLDHYSYRYHNHRESKTSLLGKMLAFIPAAKKPYDPELISLEQAARMLGVRRKTVTRWCQDGQLTARRINWRWWVKREELQDFVSDRFGVEIPLVD
jgi:succinoglycan biosynthesis transport protein ExoP